jgi:hypothetical protein
MNRTSDSAGAGFLMLAIIVCLKVGITPTYLFNKASSYCDCVYSNTEVSYGVYAGPVTLEETVDASEKVKAVVAGYGSSESGWQGSIKNPSGAMADTPKQGSAETSASISAGPVTLERTVDASGQVKLKAAGSLKFGSSQFGLQRSFKKTFWGIADAPNQGITEGSSGVYLGAGEFEKAIDANGQETYKVGVTLKSGKKFGGKVGLKLSFKRKKHDSWRPPSRTFTPPDPPQFTGTKKHFDWRLTQPTYRPITLTPPSR